MMAGMAAERTHEGTNQGIKSIEVGARVLLALEHGRGPMTLSQVAALSGLHPAKTHRYLVSLVRSGLASQSVDTGLYDLGPASRALGVEALRRTDSVSVVSSHAVGLRDETGHTVNVAVWSDAGPALVRWDTGAHALPIVVRVGSTLPLLDSAVGYVFFAHLPESVTAEVLKTQQKQAVTRPLSVREARELRELVRRDGFARTANQMIVGLAALAAPVFGAGGTLEVVVGLVLPVRMMSAAEAKRLGRLLRQTADRASEELGFSPA
jgi:DNA-binding IclR family transcriptional regulator